MRAKNIVVTGGAGFLGSHLCDRLVAEGHNVLSVDDYSTGSQANIAHLIGRPNFRAIRHDVSRPLDVPADEIYNLACPASPIHYQRDPVRTVQTCVHGAIAVLELARRQGAKILQASTSEVYGDPLQHPQVECYFGNVNPFGPRACYDEGKRCAETLFFSYRQQFGMPMKIIRIFNTYGPRMHPEDGRVVSNFVLQALRGEPLTMNGDGSQTRSFCYVDDMIEAMVRLMATDDDVVGPVNAGNPNEITIRELADEVRELTGSQSPLLHRRPLQDDPVKRRPDITLIESLTGWRPSVPLRIGLERTIAHFSDLSARGEGRPAKIARRRQPRRIPMTEGLTARAAIGNTREQ